MPAAPSARRRAQSLGGVRGTVREGLLEGWEGSGPARARLATAIAHALRFETWRSLARAEALGDAEAADLMVDLAPAAAAYSPND